MIAEQLDLELSNDVYWDGTDSVTVYEKGKTIICPNCSFKMGTFKETRQIQCGNCKELVVDNKALERDGTTYKVGQSTLGDY